MQISTVNGFRVRIDDSPAGHPQKRIFLERKTGEPVTFTDLSPYDIAALERLCRSICLQQVDWMKSKGRNAEALELRKREHTYKRSPVEGFSFRS